MDIRNSKLYPDQYFHIYNRGVNGADVFFESKNYHFFLNQYSKYVHPYVETFAYCLLKNHFHLLVKVRGEAELTKLNLMKSEKPLYWHVSNGFSSFLQSYTRAVNKMYGRTGGLFETPFRRIEVTNDAYFSALVAYIHRNPEHHGIVNDFKDYAYSSYLAHVGSADTKLNRTEVLNWFGGKRAFIDFHLKEDVPKMDTSLLLE